MNADADMKDQAKNFRLFEETLTILKKAWTEKFFAHKGEFYTYPAPDFVWQHDMSPPNEEFMDLKNNTLKKISVVPQPYQKPHPPIHQVVDGIRSIEWAAQNEWFGQDTIRTAAALAIDAELKGEGYDPNDNEFYEEVNNRLQEAFPQKYDRVQENTLQPAQVVSGASRSSPNSNRKVKLSKEDVRLAQKWGIPLEQYAAEKLKVSEADGEYTNIN